MHGLVNFCVDGIKMMYLSGGGVTPPVALLFEYPFSLIAVLPVTDPFLLYKWKHIPYSCMRSTCPSECVNESIFYILNPSKPDIE